MNFTHNSDRVTSRPSGSFIFGAMLVPEASILIPGGLPADIQRAFKTVMPYLQIQINEIKSPDSIEEMVLKLQGQL